MTLGSDSSRQLETLATLLRARLTFHHVNTMTYPARYQTPEEFITTHRFILVLEGHSRYTVEGVTTAISPGQMLFVPAWTYRVWHAQGRERCRHSYCEFSEEGLALELQTLFVNSHPRMALEKNSLERMSRIWSGVKRLSSPAETSLLSERDRLLLEGELKAILARFWLDALPIIAQPGSETQEAQNFHPDLKHALNWLNIHFLDPNALQKMYKEVHLSQNYFRTLFHRSLHCSPQHYLIRLRLRRARMLVVGSNLTFKEIATATGFSDPFFFSHRYRLFFGTSPRADRKKPHA